MQLIKRSRRCAPVTEPGENVGPDMAAGPVVTGLALSAKAPFSRLGKVGARPMDARKSLRPGSGEGDNGASSDPMLERIFA